MDNNPFASRKLIITSLTLLIISGLPILYKSIGITDQVTLIVIGAIAGATGAYNAFNTLSKKYAGDSNDQPPS